jgi:hypothetical protein
MVSTKANPLTVVTTPDQLKELVKEAVEEALDAHDGKPALLTRESLAQALSCSPGHVDNLRKQGLPTIWLRDAPRFDLVAVLDWLRTENAHA